MKDSMVTTEVVDALQKVGIEAIVTGRGQTVHLEGMVESTKMRQTATQIIAEIDPTLVIENQLEVIPIVSVPDETSGDLDTSPITEALRIVDEETAEDDRESRQIMPGADEAWGEDPGTAVPYFPPTDPVTRVGPRDTELLGGFAETSLDELSEETDDSARIGDHRRGDEEIADDVRRELAEDAATSDLRIRVRVIGGVVRLRGHVLSIDDTEAAEDVARRVPGVVDVDEGLAVTWD